MLANQDDLLADWDPLQGGFQAIVDICEEARSVLNVAPSQSPDIYEPERAGTFDHSKKTDNLIEVLQTPPSETMSPPKRFHKRLRNLLNI